MATDKQRVLEGVSLESVAKDLVKSGWSVSDANDAIEKSFRFSDFPAAFSFMTRVAFAAEAADHHPEWFNVYNRVDVRLTSHDANGVTARDLSLARVMDQTAGDS